MGESFTDQHTSCDNVNSSVLPKPALTSAIAEDDEEPPSSGGPPLKPLEITVETTVSTNQAEDVCHEEKRWFPFFRHQTPVDPEKQDSRVDAIPVHTSRFRALFTPARDIGPQPTYRASVINTLKYSPLNICLLFIPVSWVLYFTHQSATIVFVFSALAILPLAALLGLGMEQIALRTSASVGGLLNATLGNIVELIIAGIALKQCELELVQSSLLGGLLSNLLLVLGMAFIVGGFRFHQQEFQPMAAQLNSSLMTVSVISLLVPAAFHEFIGERLADDKEGSVLLQLSRGSAVILILIYVAYLFFQFYSHSHLFLDMIQTNYSSRSSIRSSITSTLPAPTTTSPSRTESESSPQPELAKLNTVSALLLLLTTIFAYITADHLVSSLTDFTASHPSVSREWLTLIVIPIISNAAEHTTAVIVARKGKFDLAMSVAVGSCIQIALFVIPVLVLVAWGMGKPLTLLFEPLETLCLFFSVLLVKFSVEDGKAHWMSGFVLVAVYMLIALSFWNFPNASVGAGGLGRGIVALACVP